MFKYGGFATACLDIKYMREENGRNPMDLTTPEGFATLGYVFTRITDMLSAPWVVPYCVNANVFWLYRSL